MKTKWLVGAVAALFLAPAGAFAAGQARTVEISVTRNGFEPARVKVTKDEPLKLVVTRKTDDTCAKQIVIPDENIKADLPLGRPVTLSFTPRRTGEIEYACGMNMVTGVLEVAPSDAADTGRAPVDRGATAERPQGMQGMHGMGRTEQHHHAGTRRGAGCGCMDRGTRPDGA